MPSKPLVLLFALPETFWQISSLERWSLGLSGENIYCPSKTNFLSHVKCSFCKMVNRTVWLVVKCEQAVGTNFVDIVDCNHTRAALLSSFPQTLPIKCQIISIQTYMKVESSCLSCLPITKAINHQHTLALSCSLTPIILLVIKSLTDFCSDVEIHHHVLVPHRPISLPILEYVCLFLYQRFVWPYPI